MQIGDFSGKQGNVRGHSSPFLLQDSPLAPSFKGGGGGGCGKGGLALHGLPPAMRGRLSRHLLRIYVWCQNRWGSHLHRYLNCRDLVQEIVSSSPIYLHPNSMLGVFLQVQASEIEIGPSALT